MAPNHVLEDPGSWCYYCDFAPVYNRDGILENEDDAENCPGSPDGEHHDPNHEPHIVGDVREQALAEAPPGERARLMSELFTE